MQAPLERFSPASFFLLVFALLTLTNSSFTMAQSGMNRPRPSNQQPAPNPATGASTVKGRIVYKDNSQPLKGMRVRIFTTSDAGLVAFTNERGEFQVSNLAAGRYYVALEGPGMAMMSGFGVRLPLPMTAIPRAEDFEEVIPKHDAQFTVDGTNTVEVEVKVPRGGTVSGKVLKPNGAPVANVPVSFLSREGGSSGPYMARFSAQTDKDGAYKINNLPEGEYVISAAESSKATVDIQARMRGEGQNQIVTYYPAATTIQQAQSIRVDAGRETGGVNITLVGRNSFSVSGTVLRQRDGIAMAGIRVILRNKESETNGALVAGMGQRTTFTDGDGRWTFGNVVEGEYVVTALAPSETPTRLPGQLPDRKERFRESRQRFLVAQQDLTIAGADLKGLLMSISGPGSITGRVETDNGTPLPSDVVLFVELVSKGGRPGPPLPVRVGPDGSFNFSNVPAGDVFLSVALSPGAKSYIKTLDAHGNDPRQTPLTVTEGTDAGPLQVVISQAIGSVSGRVLSDKVALEMGGIVVLLAPVDAEKQRFRTAYLSTRAGTDGAFSITGTPGEYFVFARKREDLPPIVSEDFVRREAANAQRVVISPGDEKRVDIRVQ